MINKLRLSLIILSIVIFLIVIGIAVSTQLGKISKKPSRDLAMPTSPPTPTFISKPSGPYTGSYSKLLDKIEKRPSLEEKDVKIRAELISLLGGSGVLYSTQDFQIYYIKTPDVFQVKILNSDVDSAKLAAIKWFESRGFSTEGICNLPIMFYLDFSIISKLPELKDTFNPLPEGC